MVVVASQDFGSVRVANAATTTATRTFDIQNGGDSTLTIDSMALAGANAGNFTIISAPAAGTQLAAGATAPVTVRFDPSAPGARSATLVVTSNDPQSPTSSALAGTGTSAVIAVTDVDFGIVAPGGTGTGAITIANTAVTNQGPLRVTSAAISGGSWFTFATNSPANCLGATSCVLNVDVPPDKAVDVRCRPPAAATGSQTATVTFTSDTDAGGDSVAQLSCNAGDADINLVTTSVAFGDVLVNPAPAPARAVTISNTGNSMLVFTASKVTSTFSGLYTLGGCFSSCSVPPGATADFTVTFNPTSPTEPNANITINVASNDPDEPTLTIPVTGRGVAPQITAPATLAFGNVEIGKMSGAQDLVVTNTGTATLVISNASLTTGLSDYIVLSGTTGSQMTTVPPMGSVTWSLVCTPAAQGARAGTFRILSNAFTQSTADVALSCNGQQGLLVVSPTSIAFGAIAQGSVTTRTFTLSNTGNLPVTNIAAVVNPANVGYSIDPAGNPVPASLAPGASVTLTVRFAPLTTTDGGAATITFAGGWGTTPTQTTAALSLTGSVLSDGYELSTALVDFGNLRFDTTLDRTFCIVNTGQTSVTIQSPIAIVPATGTVTGEFSVVRIRKPTTCGGASTTDLPLPQTLSPAQLLEVTVRVDPANRAGMMQATLTVNSNLATNPTRTLALRASSTTGAFTLAPGSLIDFGGVDVQGAAASQTITITITNTGDGPLDLTSFLRTADPEFTITLPGNTTLQPTQSVNIPVTYKPVVASPAGSEETVTLTHAIAGDIDGPTSQTIIIRGRGIDRTLSLSPTPTFPDTFRNPGDEAPVRPVTVRNLGEATLKISAVMLADISGAWQLVAPPPAPVDLPKNATQDFLVRFAPMAAGPAQAKLVIMNDDSDRPMASVDLVGRGLDRAVRFGPDAIRIGFTGVGVPVTLGGALAVTSVDPAHTFRIRAIELDQDSPFQIEGLTPEQELAPLAERTFAVTFTPEREGVFTAKARLYLDMDPVAQQEITIEGSAYSIDVHGGGGCTAGRGPGGSAMLLVLAALGAVRPRRRRRAARGLAALAALAALGALVAPPTPAALADDLQVGVFHPVPATSGTGFQLEPADVGRAGEWIASGVYSYATNPMVIDATIEGAPIGEARPISRRSMLELGGAYAFLGRFEAGARMPFYSQQGDAATGDSIVQVEPASGTALGDLTLHGKARIARSAWLTLGASLHVTLPTSTEDRFAGADRPSVKLLGLAALTPSPRLTLSLNGGPVLRETAVYRKGIFIEQGSGLAWGAGASLRLADKLSVTGEVFGEWVPKREQMLGSLSPIEGLVGASYRLARKITVGAAIGRGISSGLGAPDLRGTVTLSFAPGRVEPGPGSASPRAHIAGAGGIPDRDTDRDGIVGARDKCPQTIEDRDGFEDQDGCPELDNDGDGLTDAQDRCPLSPETINGNQDDDGCPDEGGDPAAPIAVDPDQSPAKAAEATFRRGRELMQEKKYFAACTAFEQSQRLDPQAGTQYNLAGCYVEIGKLATALNLYSELARLDKNAERRQLAAELAARLAARVPKIKLSLVGRPADISVFMNGTNVNALIGIESPVDFGTYTIVAGAPGHRGWRQVVEVKQEGALATVVIDLGPPLKP